MTVYIVTNPELGWDCIMEVFATKELAIDYCKYINPDWKEHYSSIIIHEETVRTK